LKENTETILFTLRGDVILGSKDSSEIIIKSVEFAEELNEDLELEHGYITFSENEIVTYGSIEAPAIKTFTLTIKTNTIDGGIGGTATPLGTTTRDTGEVVRIEAIPNSGYKFVN
jgi:hypothetical protein